MPRNERRESVRQRRVVLTPRGWRRRWQQYMAHRGDHVISRKAIAQGRPDALRWTCMLMRALLVHIAHETAGAARTRSSLRPLLVCEGETDANLGHLMPRECGPMPSRCLTIKSEQAVTYCSLPWETGRILAHPNLRDFVAFKYSVARYSKLARKADWAEGVIRRLVTSWQTVGAAGYYSLTSPHAIRPNWHVVV